MSHRILAEQLNLNAQQIKLILVIVLLMSLTGLIYFWPRVPHNILLGWFILVNCPSIMRLALLYVQRDHSVELRILVILNIFFAAWSGLAWGAVGYFFPPYGDDIMLQYITISLFGITSGAVPGLSSFVPAYFAFSLPVMAGLSYRLYCIGDEASILASIVCIIYLMINLAFSLIFQKSFLQSIRLRFMNTDLVQNLRQEKNKAIQASDAKSSFLAATSHDLRQPLHAMGFFIESLKKKITDREQKYLLQKIERTSNNLRGQLNDLLDISKIDAGIIKPHMAPLSLNDIFKTLERVFSPQAQEKEIQLICRPTTWIIESDAHMIDRILNNLVSNAVRYTDHGGKILLGCRKKGRHLSIEIHDTGIGIPEHLIENIFNEHYQIDNPERSRNKGLGLGLSIVKGMSDLLGHDVKLRSTMGQGTSFFLTIPLSTRQPEIIPDTPPKSGQIMKTGNIILIDDEKDTLDAMSHLIESWGYKVIPFGAEDDVIRYLNSHDYIPDMIITDFRLRKKRTGTQAITAINKHLGKNIPAIIITGDTAKHRMFQAQQSGHILLHKPIKPEKLKAIINETLMETTLLR